MRLYDVSAYCEDETGGSDGAYDLIADGQTPEEVCASLLATLKAGWGLVNAQGQCTLHISIKESRQCD